MMIRHLATSEPRHKNISHLMAMAMPYHNHNPLRSAASAGRMREASMVVRRGFNRRLVLALSHSRVVALGRLRDAAVLREGFYIIDPMGWRLINFNMMAQAAWRRHTNFIPHYNMIRTKRDVC